MRRVAEPGDVPHERASRIGDRLPLLGLGKTQNPRSEPGACQPRRR
jgi:hypothetical protein